MIQVRGCLAEGLNVGDRAVFSRTFTEADVALFGGVTYDTNPYHTDGLFARRSRFKRPIVHGLLVGSMLTHVGGQWAWLASSLVFDFLAPVFVGDRITLEVVIEAVDERGCHAALARWVNARGLEVARAVLRGYPPRPQERALLKRVPGRARASLAARLRRRRRPD